MVDKMEIAINKNLVFDVWTEYARFRKFYNTTSPLTFSLPPRTTLCGLLGAIIGLDKTGNDYLRYFTLDQASIGVKIINPIKKTMIAQNLIHTKNAHGPGMNLITQRTQINFEFLKSPKYRIYFSHSDNDLYLKLKRNLEEHKSFYTPVLGLSENIADFKFIGEFDVLEKKSKDIIQINSAIPLSQITLNEGAEFDYEAEYFSERIPLELTTERIVTKYDDILFERNGKPISVALHTHYYQINYDSHRKENIVFLE